MQMTSLISDPGKHPGSFRPNWLTFLLLFPLKVKSQLGLQLRTDPVMETDHIKYH